jgi:hypothetical protein
VETIGKLSNDGKQYWDGRRWLPTLSADGRWRWTGAHWDPVESRIEAAAASAAEKGSDLERRIATFFAENGYTAQTNQKLLGRSGGLHEIDILAQHNDGVTSVRIAVECKAWQARIDKSVIAKAAYVCADLGINKVIVVSLHGWQVGAERAAADQGIELWGPTELEQRLGRIPAALATQGPTRRIASGFQIAVAPNVAEKAFGVERGGFLGLGAETLERTVLIWLPICILELICSHAERGKTLRTTTTWTAYESLSGRLFTTFQSSPQLMDVDIGQSRLAKRVAAIHIASRIRKSIEKRQSVVTASAQERYEHQLKTLGIPAGTRSVTVEKTIEAFIPVYVGFLSRRGARRAAAVDAVWGRAWRSLSEALTTNIGYLGDAIGG